MVVAPLGHFHSRSVSSGIIMRGRIGPKEFSTYQHPRTSKKRSFGIWHNRLLPTWPEFDSLIRCHMWVGFVIGSCAFSERFFAIYISKFHICQLIKV